ncbi:MAG: filamentous hemagglutinin N-terminal domain-containing protein, partial [Gammaproteobacteria bacterium]
MSRRAAQSAASGAGSPLRPARMALAVRAALLPGLAAALAPVPGVAAPTGGVVRAGSAAIAQDAGQSLTTVQQHSQRAAIDWQRFDLAPHEQVRFVQPNAQSSVLNRILDQRPSEIFGRVSANGQVLLMNPNGVFFRPGAQVDVGSLVAGAMQIGIDDFMRGNYRLEARAGSAGRVLNQGEIRASAGDVALVGRSVANEGVIVATAGRVQLAAGEKVTVDFDGDGLLRFSVDEAVLDNAEALDDQVRNSGSIVADGGEVLISARAAEGVFRNAINNEGLIRAGRIDKSGGTVRLVGLGPAASVLNTGRIEAAAESPGDAGGAVEIRAGAIRNEGLISADAGAGDGGGIHLEADTTNVQGAGAVLSARGGADGVGGTVAVLGEQVALEHDARIDASGGQGGGAVLMGGDVHGANPVVRNARTTFVATDAVIAADALDNGDGGKVVVWADDTTRYHGTTSARGGASGGDGGFVEVSGKETLLMRGNVDTRAPAGATGTLLLDPATLTIIDDVATSGDHDATVADEAIAAGDADIGGNTVSWGAIDALGASANVVLEATGLVTIDDVTGNAGGAISANDLVTLDLDAGSLTITSTGGNVVFVDANDVVRTEGGAITINAAGSVDLGGFDTTGAGGAQAGAVTINTASGGTLGSVTTGGATLTLNIGAGSLGQVVGSVISGTTALDKQGAGTLVLADANTYSGATSVGAGTLQAASAAGLSANSDVTLAAGTVLDVNDFAVDVAAFTGNTGTLDLGAGGELSASGNVDLTGTSVVTAGGGDNRIDAVGGTLTVDTLTKSDAGNLTLAGATAIDLNGTVDVDAGNLVIEDTFTAAGDLLASGDVTLSGVGTLDGGVAQRVDAEGGTLTAVGLTKTGAGDLTLAGATALDLNATVDV